jgi:hypothetical protein
MLVGEPHAPIPAPSLFAASRRSGCTTTPCRKDRGPSVDLSWLPKDKVKIKILDDLLAPSVVKVSRAKVLGPSDLNALLAADQLKQSLGCEDVSCLAEIGGALGVRLLLSGTVGILGQGLLVTLSLIDAQTKEVVRRGKSKVSVDENYFDAAIDLAVADLFEVQQPPSAREHSTTLVELDERSLGKPKCTVGNKDECKTWCKKGDYVSCSIVAEMYRLGDGADLDLNEARSAWLSAIVNANTACGLADRDACFFAGQIHFLPKGTDRRTSSARMNFEKACQLEHPLACSLLSKVILEENGPYGEKKSEVIQSAKEMKNKACSLGYKKACSAK